MKFKMIIGGCILVPAVFSNFADARESRRKVLVLHSYHQGLEWTDNVTRGIREVFAPHDSDFEMYYEYLDAKRNAGAEYFQKLYQLQKAKKTTFQFSIILVSDNAALSFVIKHGKELYGDAPVVFCGINNFQKEMLAGQTHVTGVVENTDFEGTLALIRKFHPERRKITVIVDQTPTGKAIRESLMPVLPRFPELEFDFYQDFLLSEVEGEIGRLGSEDIIYLLAFNRDRNDNFISYTEGIGMVSSAADVPIYGSWDFYLGKGIVGGILTTGSSQGRTAAEMALDILGGRSLSEIPIESASATFPVFDFNQLERFKIKTELLPENSTVINAPPSLRERYTLIVFILFFTLVAVSLLMGTWLYIVRRRHDRIAETARILEEKVVERTRLLEEEKSKLEETIAQVKTLHGMLPICASCKKIRDDKGYWNQIEGYISRHTDAVFSHGICPDCQREMFEELYSENGKKHREEDW